MGERGISFSGPMVSALLAGAKTQTRRVVKEKNVASALRDGRASKCCPFHVGDRLWVREAYCLPARFDGLAPNQVGEQFVVAGSRQPQAPVRYEADGATRHWSLDEIPGKPRAGMFMPRWVSRIMLAVVDVRVERLDACGVADAIAEGIETAGESAWRKYGVDAGATNDPLESYRSLWAQINGAGSWESNPLVWVVEFRTETNCSTSPD
jgi:hypothetical protein